HTSLAAGDARVVKKGTTAKQEAPVKVEADEQEALKQVVEFYHETLKESPEALRYLESRGADASGDAGAVTAWLREPDAGLPLAG
ncbi:MAG: hypothetical protein ACK532_20245, partial [Acidobacteriota bacterium]